MALGHQPNFQLGKRELRDTGFLVWEVGLPVFWRLKFVTSGAGSSCAAFIVLLWAPSHFPDKMPDIRPCHPLFCPPYCPRANVLPCQMASHLPSPLFQCGGTPCVQAAPADPKAVETMGVRAVLFHSLPLGCVHFLPAGCLRKCPCPGTVWSGLCFPRGPHPCGFQGLCPLWSQHSGYRDTPSLAMSWTLQSSGRTLGCVPSSPSCPVFHSLLLGL